MPAHSLGYRTDLIFRKFDANIIERDDYIVILSPSHPNYFWGNFLLFKVPPSQGCMAEWEKVFAHEIESQQEVHHRAFGWDIAENNLGEHREFLDAGYTIDQSVVQTTNAVHKPPKYNSEIEIRPLRDDEWMDSLEIQVLCKPDHFQEHIYRAFRKHRMSRYREMRDAGLGNWFGAFLDGTLVADLGIFKDDDVGRFQNVTTHPDFRRRGICSTIIYETSQYAFEQLGIETLVIVADVDYHAKEIYTSVGFSATEYQAGLQWFDPQYA